MASFFPQVTGAFPMGEKTPHRFWMSPVAMGIATGVAVRLYRAATLSIGPSESMVYAATAFVIGQLIVLGMATLHLGNFTVRRWVWLAPAFALVEAITESVVSLALIGAGVERIGSVAARMSDWSGLAINALIWRVLVILAWALLLAGVVQLVRRFLLRREHREHTLEALSHDDASTTPRS